MRLVPGIAEFVEYPLTLALSPTVPQAGRPVVLTFTVRDPKTGKQVKDFEIMHEKLYHLFMVSQDLQFFEHVHPQLKQDGTFQLETTLPRPGMYRILSDFYPRNGSPQLVTNTVIVPGGPITPGAKLVPDLTPCRAANMQVALTMNPKLPIAGIKTLMFFQVSPSDSLEPYLGTWGHMLVASADLVDMIHTHPFLADGGPQIQFNVIFPRPVVHRVWVQFQRKGIVNTAVFNVPVSELK